MKKTKKINIRITEQQLKTLLIESIKTDKSKSILIREMIEDYNIFCRKRELDEKIK
jgi:predicted DNA-binding protein